MEEEGRGRKGGRLINPSLTTSWVMRNRIRLLHLLLLSAASRLEVLGPLPKDVLDVLGVQRLFGTTPQA